MKHIGVLVEHHSDSMFYKRIGLHQLAEAAALVLLHSFCFARIFFTPDVAINFSSGINITLCILLTNPIERFEPAST